MQENGHRTVRNFDFPYNCVPVIQTHFKLIDWYQNVEFSSPYHQTKFESNGCVITGIPANVFCGVFLVVDVFIFKQNHISTVLSLEIYVQLPSHTL